MWVFNICSFSVKLVPSSTLSHGEPLVEESCISMMDTFVPFTQTNVKHLLKRFAKKDHNVLNMPYCKHT